MALKRALVPLTDTDLLEKNDLDNLRRHSITTVEEVVGAIDADASAMAHVLHRTVADVRSLRRRAIQFVPARNRERLERSVERFKLGAFPPSASRQR